MTAARSLLVELLVEELPPKDLKRLGAAFALELAKGLHERHFLAGPMTFRTFASPRRLGVVVDGVQRESTPREIPAENFMPASVAYDAAGRPTPALVKKLKRRYHDAIDVDAVIRDKLETVEEGGKLVVKHRAELSTPSSLQVGLEAALEDAIERLPIAKTMQYQLADGWTTVSFVRPAHRLVALHGDEVVAVSALGLDAGRVTEGHRFEALVPEIVVRDPESYESQLRDEGAVIASFDARRAEIDRQLAAAAAREGLRPIDDEALRDEVAALVERPNVLTCRFDAEFLAVPPECLVLTMKANQKYFPLLERDGRLTNRFLVVSNIAPADPAQIVAGNERVVRPRLADAKFFFDQDKKRTLASRVPELDKVVYHRKLGSQGERVRRVVAIVGAICAKLASADVAADAGRAALLAKADLTTSMVGEFPELQGVMGRYYALADGEREQVAFAIEDHYRPRFAGDALPRSVVGVIVALADKLETLVGLFGVGELPTGDKDPYGLRRQALGVVRLLIERSLTIGLQPLIDLTIAQMPPDAKCDWLPVFEFVKERAKGYFEEQGFDRRAVDAVLEPHGALFPLGQLPEVVREASRFIASPEGQLLAEANKRITNILKKSGDEVPFGMSPRTLAEAPDANAFVQDEERALFAALLSAGEQSLSLRADRNYAQALSALIPLSGPTKAFFDKVMVNVADENVRANRVRLLQHARAYMNQVADLTLMSR